MDPVTLALINNQKGQPNGIATLNNFGLHNPHQMPSWFGVFPITDRWAFPYGSPTTFQPEGNRMYGHPVVIMRDCAIKAIACNVTTAGGAGSVVRLGIYKELDRDTESSQNRMMATRVLDAGTVDSSTTGIKTITIEPVVSLTAGVHWLVAVAQVNTDQRPTLRAVTGFNPSIPAGGFNATSSTGAVGLTGNTNTVSGALPASNTNVQLYILAPTVPLVAVQFA